MGENKNFTEKEYEDLGRKLVGLQHGLLPGRGYYRAAFLRGIVTGFGGVIGATLLVTLLLWMLSAFDSLPVIGDFVDTIKNSLTSSN